MSKRLQEQQEVTRGTLALRGLWVVVACGLLLVAALAFEKRLGISPDTAQTLLKIFSALAALEGWHSRTTCCGAGGEALGAPCDRTSCR